VAVEAVVTEGLMGAVVASVTKQGVMIAAGVHMSGEVAAVAALK
jgi:hypothetical protein